MDVFTENQRVKRTQINRGVMKPTNGTEGEKGETHHLSDV